MVIFSICPDVTFQSNKIKTLMSLTFVVKTFFRRSTEEPIRSGREETNGNKEPVEFEAGEVAAEEEYEEYEEQEETDEQDGEKENEGKVNLLIISLSFLFGKTFLRIK